MKTKLLVLCFVLISISAFAQDYIFGKVRSEFGAEMSNAIIINTRTEEKVSSDKDGNYMIAARISDELRFVKSGYDRISVKISNEHYSAPVNVSLPKSAYLIEEIELAFTPTGNLKKDSKLLDAPKKLVALQGSLDAYMKSPMQEAVPQATTIPSAFKPKDLGEGTISLLSVGSGGSSGLLSAVAGLIKPSKRDQQTAANYSETQAFYRRVKAEIDLSFYWSRGWTEEDLDRFLIYADNSYSLAKKYRKSFDIAAISSDMKMAYIEYIKTHKVGT